MLVYPLRTVSCVSKPIHPSFSQYDMPDVSGPMVMPSHPGAPPTPLSMSSAYNMHHSRLTPDVLTHFSGHPLIQRRFLSNFHSPEYRIYEMNKRMKLRPEDGDIIWWDGFVTEFFHENSSLSLSFTLEDGPKRFTIGRPLIPRYFRSIFENDVTDVFYYLNQSKEAYHHNTFFIEAERAEIHTTHVKPVPTYVTTEGKLTLEFSLDEGLRIKSWHFAIRNHSEFLLRSYVSNHLQQTLCLILEPMQELMTHHRISGKSPRESLKDVLFQKWHKISAPSTKCSPVVLSSPSSAGEVNPPARVTTKRRKRKTSSASSTASTTVTITSSVASNSEPITTTSPSSMSPPAKKRSNSTCNTHFNPSQVDVMVVGEPTLMGGEFGEEDERLITRLENSQAFIATPFTNGASSEFETSVERVETPPDVKPTVLPADWKLYPPKSSFSDISVRSPFSSTTSELKSLGSPTFYDVKQARPQQQTV